MKSLNRSYTLWPGIDASIVATVCGCTICQDNRPTPAKTPLHLWEWPT